MRREIALEISKEKRRMTSIRLRKNLSHGLSVSCPFVSV